MNHDEILKIRYAKVLFTLTMTEDCILPVHKTSGFRGGIGEMLLRKHCINSKRDCGNCGFSEECLVQRTMYSGFRKSPESVNVGESIGYVMECSDHRTKFQEGDELKFTLTMFGKCIVYFSQYLYALADLGMCGLGKNEGKFVISRITNLYGEDILEGNQIYMNRYKASTLGEYVSYRTRKNPELVHANTLVFHSPTTIKYKGEKLEEFHAEALVKAIIRRLYILGCYEDLNVEEYRSFTAPIPVIVMQEYCSESIRRYSNRKKSAMWMKGITGTVELDHIPEELIDLFLAAEVTFVGSNTHFGFGKFKVI